MLAALPTTGTSTPASLSVRKNVPKALPVTPLRTIPCGLPALMRAIKALTLMSVGLKCSKATTVTFLFSGRVIALRTNSSAACPLASVVETTAMRVNPRSRSSLISPGTIDVMAIAEAKTLCCFDVRPGERQNSTGPFAISGISAAHAAT
jgi:hypothetical protein